MSEYTDRLRNKSRCGIGRKIQESHRGISCGRAVFLLVGGEAGFWCRKHLRVIGSGSCLLYPNPLNVVTRFENDRNLSALSEKLDVLNVQCSLSAPFGKPDVLSSVPLSQWAWRNSRLNYAHHAFDFSFQ